MTPKEQAPGKAPVVEHIGANAREAPSGVSTITPGKRDVWNVQTPEGRALVIMEP